MRTRIGRNSRAWRRSRWLGALVASVACGGGTPGPEPITTTPTDTGRAVTLDGRLLAPTGMTITYFARDLDGVRFMAVAPDGAVYASQPSRGRVVRLPDANRDGAADSVVTVVSGLALPHGLAFHKGSLYVAATDGVVRVTLGADGKATGSPLYVNR